MDGWSRPGELDVFATGDTSVVASQLPSRPSAIGDVVRRSSAAVRDLHARPGHRPGTPIATTSGRRTGPADIIRPVHLDPRRAAAFALEDLFRDPIAGLTLDNRTADTQRRYLVWTGRLSSVRFRPVRVAIHLLASPSMAVTVLELVPQDSVRWSQRAFVHAGIDVMEHLADRLDTLATASHGVAITPAAQTA